MSINLIGLLVFIFSIGFMFGWCIRAGFSGYKSFTKPEKLMFDKVSNLYEILYELKEKKMIDNEVAEKCFDCGDDMIATFLSTNKWHEGVMKMDFKELRENA